MCIVYGATTTLIVYTHVPSKHDDRVTWYGHFQMALSWHWQISTDAIGPLGHSKRATWMQNFFHALWNVFWLVLCLAWCAAGWQCAAGCLLFRVAAIIGLAIGIGWYQLVLSKSKSDWYQLKKFSPIWRLYQQWRKIFKASYFNNPDTFVWRKLHSYGVVVK